MSISTAERKRVCVINHPVFTLCLAFAAFVSVLALDFEVVCEPLMRYDNQLQHQRNTFDSFSKLLHQEHPSAHDVLVRAPSRIHHCTARCKLSLQSTLTKLQDEIMDLNKIIENTAADHRRKAHPLYPSFLLKYNRRSLGTSPRHDLSQHEDTVAHVQTRSDSQGGQSHSGENEQAFPRDRGVLHS